MTAAKKKGSREPIRVLQILNHMDYGGIEAVVMNYYRYIDKAKVQFDFVVCRDSVLPQKEEIRSLGGNIYLLPPVSHLPGYLRAVQKLIKSRRYEVVHCHMNTLCVFPLYAAWRAGAKVRICHNHTTAHRGEGAKTILKYLLRPMNRWFATDYFACGEYAGKWMYGKRALQSGRVYLMRNAIDVEKFRYNTIARISMRIKMDLADKFVVGHIGRFMYQKNHEFLIDVFYEVHRRNQDAVLLLIGEGELEGQIRRKVKRLGLEESVIFYGTSRDTSMLYQVMDVFCLPSYYEGLPVVAVEAQMNGLSVITSKNVTQEMAVLDSCRQISLKEDVSVWAAEVLKANIRESARQRAWKVMEKSGFSIGEEAGKLEKWYEIKMDYDRKDKK